MGWEDTKSSYEAYHHLRLEWWYVDSREMQYNGRLWLSLGKVTSDDRWNDYQEMGQHSFYVIWQTIPVTECSTWQSWWKYFGIPKGSQNTWKRRGHWEKISLPSPVKSWGKTAQKLHMWDCHTFLCHIWKDQCQCQALIAAPYQFIPAKSPTVKWTDVSVRWSRTLTAVVGRLVDMKKSPVQYVLLLSPYFFLFYLHVLCSLRNEFWTKAVLCWSLPQEVTEGSGVLL